MITISSTKLQALKESKTAIAEAIRSKGGVVSETDGLTQFATLINALPSDVPSSAKAYYEERQGDEITTTQYIELSVDFEPKAIFVHFNITEEMVSQNMPSFDSTNLRVPLAMFRCETSFVAGQENALGLNIGYKYDETDISFSTFTKKVFAYSENAETGKWDVKIGTEDSSSTAYRMIIGNTYPVQILVIG